MVRAFLFKYLKKFKAATAGIVVLTALATLFEGAGIMMIIPLLSYVASKSGSPDTGFPLLNAAVARLELWFPGRLIPVFSLLLLVLVGLKNLFGYLSRLAIYVLTEKTALDISRTLYEKFISFSMSFHHKIKSGVLINAINTQAVGASQMLELAVSMAVSLGYLAAFLAILLYFSWKVTLLMLLYIVLLSAVVTGLVRHIRRVSRGTIRPLEVVQNVIVEGLSAVATIKIFGSREFEMRRMTRALWDSYHSRLRLRYWKLLVVPLFEVMILLSGLLIVNLFGALYGEVQIPLLMAYLFVMFRIAMKVQEANNNRALIAGLVPNVERIEELLRADNVAPVIDGSRRDLRFERSIFFDAVRFGYGHREPVLRELSFAVAKGEKVALVGSSGSGKTTVLNLLARFYSTRDGGILIDGVNINEFSLDLWPGLIGYVTQDTFLFSDTIRANIAYGRPEFSEADVMQAARLANADAFIRQLKDGYDTIVGERGATLSGGQRQRIAIARMILRDPRLILLDEATSALDTESEALIKRSLEEATRDKTVVCVAHRISTVMNFDKILVLDAGRIVESGSPRALVGGGGAFQRLVQSQQIVA